MAISNDLATRLGIALGSSGAGAEIAHLLNWVTDQMPVMTPEAAKTKPKAEPAKPKPEPKEPPKPKEEPPLLPQTVPPEPFKEPEEEGRHSRKR